MVATQRASHRTAGAGAGASSHRAPRSHSTAISLSELWSDAHLRMDASSYGVELRRVQDLLRQNAAQLKPLTGPAGLCEDAATPIRFKRAYVAREHGVPFVTSSAIIDLRPDPEHFISKALTRRLDQIRISKWDILISRSGTVGNVSLAGGRIAGMALSEDAMRVAASDPDIAGFVTGYLRSRAGRVQLTEAAYGSVVVHIEPNHLRGILVPDLPLMQMRTIGHEMRRATELRDEANFLLDQADASLREVLALPCLEELTAERRERPRVRISELGDRLESAFHDPAAHALETLLKSTPRQAAMLGDPGIASVRAITKFRKRVYVPSGGIPLLPSKQLYQFDPVDVKGLARGAHLDDLPEIQLAENMIVVSCSGTVGRVQIIPRYMSAWTASQDALRVIAAGDMNPGFLYAWLASDYGQLLVRRLAYGSVILHIDREQLRSVLVPLLPAEQVAEIGDLVLEANRKRDEAWTRERGAIGQIEALIGLS